MTGKVGKGTARQTFRYDPEKWTKVGKAAKGAGTDRTALIRDYLDWLLGDPDAPEPRRLVTPNQATTQKEG